MWFSLSIQLRWSFPIILCQERKRYGKGKSKDELFLFSSLISSSFWPTILSTAKRIEYLLNRSFERQWLRKGQAKRKRILKLKSKYAGPQEQVLPEQPCDAFNLFQQKTRLKEIVTRIVAPGDPVPSPAWRLYKNTCASPPLLKRMEKAKDKPRIMKTKEFSLVVFLLFPNSFVAVWNDKYTAT